MKPDGIIIHHSSTRDSATVSWEAIRRYHVETNGWSDIGYHFGIERIGEDFHVLGGRPVHLPGAHTVGHNSAIGVCLVGDFDRQLPEPEALALLHLLVVGLLITHGLTPGQVYFHGDFAPKVCPGKLFPRREFLSKISAAMARIGGTA